MVYSPLAHKLERCSILCAELIFLFHSTNYSKDDILHTTPPLLKNDSQPNSLSTI